MTLRSPSERYLGELKHVANSANALRSYLAGQPNTLPIGFPRAAVEVLCQALEQLPSGSVEGSIIILEVGREQCPTIRRKYIPLPRSTADQTPFADAPPEYRGGVLDRIVNELYSAIGTAIDAYTDEYGDSYVKHLNLEAGIRSEVPFDLSDALAASHRAEKAIRDFRTEHSETIDQVHELNLALADVDNGLKAARSAASMPEPKPKLLQRLGVALRKAPELLQTIGRGAQIAADVGEPIVKAMVQITAVPWSAVLEAIAIAGKGIEEAGIRLAGWRDKENQKALDRPEPDRQESELNFEVDYAEVVEKLVQGNQLPKRWLPKIRHLNFQGIRASHWQAPEKSATEISRCTNLESLNLSSVPFASFEFLKHNTNLRDLVLANTPVSNLNWISSLKELRYLNVNAASKLFDLEGLYTLTNLEHLEIRLPHVIDCTRIISLPSLKFLALSTATYNLDANRAALAKNPHVKVLLNPRKRRTNAQKKLTKQNTQRR